MGFFVVFVGCFKFSTVGCHCAGRDIRIRARIIWDGEVVAVVCEVKIVLYGEAKMPLLSSTIRTGDVSAFWLACCWIFCMLTSVGLQSHGVSFRMENGLKGLHC